MKMGHKIPWNPNPKADRPTPLFPSTRCAILPSTLDTRRCFIPLATQQNWINLVNGHHAVHEQESPAPHQTPATVTYRLVGPQQAKPIRAGYMGGIYERVSHSQHCDLPLPDSDVTPLARCHHVFQNIKLQLLIKTFIGWWRKRKSSLSITQCAHGIHPFASEDESKTRAATEPQ